MLVPGWAATAEVHKRNAILFAEAGRRTIVISAPHGIPVVPGEYKNIPVAEAARKAAAIECALQTTLINRADVVTHSEAAIFVTVAALKQPERYRSITYIAPASLMRADRSGNSLDGSMLINPTDVRTWQRKRPVVADMDRTPRSRKIDRSCTAQVD